MPKLYTEPQISPRNLDPSVDWVVWFRFFHSGRWRLCKFKKGINRYKSRRERLVEANALRAALLEELAAGWSPFALSPHVQQTPTLPEAVSLILEAKEAHLRPKSRQAYKYISKIFVDWCAAEGFAALSGFTQPDAARYMAWLQGSRGYSPRTHNDHLLILASVFNAIIARGWLQANPFRGVKRQKNPVGRNHAFTDEERRQLLAALPEGLQRYVLFMYYCFIRREELLYLKVKHVDRRNHTITVPGESAKNGFQESVVIPVGLEPVLDAMQLSAHDPEDYLFGRGFQTCGRRGYGPNYVTNLHNAYVRESGIAKEKGLYSWKHTGVCDAYYKTGKDIYALMRQLRHRDLTTTAVYLKSLGLIQNDAFRQAVT